MRHSCIAFCVAILELAVVSAKNVVEGKITVFDECMVLMTNRLVYGIIMQTESTQNFSTLLLYKKMKVITLATYPRKKRLEHEPTTSFVE